MFTLIFTLSSMFESPHQCCKGAAGGAERHGAGVRGPCAGAACLLAPPASPKESREWKRSKT
eukprot:2122487-Prymnesium_polylepis.1